MMAGNNQATALLIFTPMKDQNGSPSTVLNYAF
jgi:hypothetical protein